jgi:RHS repeat-associated protein
MPLWDGMEILATANADGTLREYYTRGPGIAGDVGSLIAEHSFATGQTVFLQGNHRGDVVLATDDAGAVVGRYEYSAFGMPLSATGAYTPRFGFSSKERDASGLVYYGLRFYSPELCRWITPDPIREDGGLNLYRFCGNDPVNHADPFGLDRWVIDHLHTYIVVEVYDKGRVVGYEEIEFSIFGVDVNSTTKPRDDGGNFCRKISSTCNEDKILLDVANDLDKLPWYKFHYNVIMFNCRHFTAYMRDVGLNKEPPPLILIPLLPPVLPGVKQ